MLDQWAIKWGVPPAAIADLANMICNPHVDASPNLTSEAGVQSAVRLEASQKSGRLWRNNVGAMFDDTQRMVRFGLANDSQKVNELIKSGDLIGPMPILITPAHVGKIIGQFTSREIKKPGWRYTGTDRELAQFNWALLVNSLGGNATFATGVGTL